MKYKVLSRRIGDDLREVYSSTSHLDCYDYVINHYEPRLCGEVLLIVRVEEEMTFKAPKPITTYRPEEE